MNLEEKTQKWVDRKIITQKQRTAILAEQNERRRPFVLLGILWLGIFCVGLGIVSVLAVHWHTIPEGGKLTGLGALLTGALGVAGWALVKEKHLITEAALFFAFLIIGGGIGLIGQIFHLPADTFKGMLLWAALSFGIVFISKRQLLGLLWVPLFIGGVLGAFRWELLLLFFQQTPVIAIVSCAGVCLAIAYMTKQASVPFLKSIYHWAVILFFVILFLGDLGSRQIGVGFFASIAMMILMALFAVHYDKKTLFNWVCFLIAVRCILLYIQVTRAFETLGVAFMVGGVMILIGAGVWYQLEQRLFKQPKEMKKELEF